jgi:Tol biopolymer transport system component
MIKLPALPRWTLALAFAISVGTCAVPAAAIAASGPTMRVSVSTAGVQGEGASQSPSISDSGLVVAFVSDASNLVAGHPNASQQILVRNRTLGTTVLASVDSSEVPGNESSPFAPSISADGRFVAFESLASNLVPDDTNGCSDIFVRDLDSGETTRVSVGPDGAQLADGSHTPSISSGGGFVAFAVESEANGTSDVYVYERATGTAGLVSVTASGARAVGWNAAPSISDDGLLVAFSSDASNIVEGDTNGTGDVFVRDVTTDITSRVSERSSGIQGNGESASPSISGDGARVAFTSAATDLVENDANATLDVFLHDRGTHVTTRVSVSSSGTEGDGASQAPAISADGRRVAFTSDASKLVVLDTNGMLDVFVRNTDTSTTIRVSVNSAGAQVAFGGDAPSLSAAGLVVAFDSEAPDLVSVGDSNGFRDVFVNDATPPVKTTLKAKASSSRPKRNKYVTISSTLSGHVPSGSYVLYEVRLPGKSSYKTISSKRPVSATGSSSVRYKLTKKGTYYFRVRFLGVPGFSASSSKSVKVVVR